MPALLAIAQRRRPTLDCAKLFGRSSRRGDTRRCRTFFQYHLHFPAQYPRAQAGWHEQARQDPWACAAMDWQLDWLLDWLLELAAQVRAPLT